LSLPTVSTAGTGRPPLLTLITLFPLFTMVASRFRCFLQHGVAAVLFLDLLQVRPDELPVHHSRFSISGGFFRFVTRA
jgi:hypothetical protein